MRMILDGMGGDLAPASVVEGAVLALKEMEHEIVFVGQKELIEQELKKYTYDKNSKGIYRNKVKIANDVQGFKVNKEIIYDKTKLLLNVTIGEQEQIQKDLEYII